MQIIFAAPFILLAGIVFTVLSVIPRARRWALPIPCGILGAGVFACLAMFAGIVVTQLTQSPTPTRYPLLAFYWAAAISGLAGGVATGAAARWVAALLPDVLLRLAVFFAAWCSYFVLMAGLLFSVNVRASGPVVRSAIAGGIAIGVELVLSFIGAWFIAQRAEDFRYRRLRLPFGAPFRDRVRTGGGGSAGSDPRRGPSEGLPADIAAPPEDKA
jgi:hypothetical protein